MDAPKRQGVTVSRDGYLRWTDGKKSTIKAEDLMDAHPDGQGVHAFNRSYPGDTCLQAKPKNGISTTLLIRKGKLASTLMHAGKLGPGRFNNWRNDRFTTATLPHPCFEPHPNAETNDALEYLSGPWQKDRLASIFHNRFSNGRDDGMLGTAGMPGLVDAGLVREDQTLTEIGVIVAERMARRCHARIVFEAERYRTTNPEWADFEIEGSAKRLQFIINANAKNAISPQPTPPAIDKSLASHQAAARHAAQGHHLR